MAIARCPAYIKDMEELDNLIYNQTDERISEEVKTTYERLCQKWELKLPIPPKLQKDNETFFKANQLEAVVELTEQTWPSQPILIWYQEVIGRYKYVRLKIDTRKTEKELLKAFGDRIKLWKKPKIQKEKGRIRKTGYDPWEVYDLHQCGSGLSLLKIARKLHGKNFPPGMRTPAYNSDLWPPYKKVQNAYNKANNMIQAVLEKYSPSNIS
jgi:hypothetical protein